MLKSLRRTLFLLLLLLGALPLRATLPATTVWEVRPTVGSDTTAGVCFDSAKGGTDYSQQNSAQYNATDLASVSSLVISSASHNFVAADVGNCIHITAGTGFTVGYYEIVSTASNQATLDRSPGTVGVSGTYYVGGAGATLSNVNSNAQPSNITYVKATGSYTVTATMTITMDSHNAPGTPYAFIGYTTTRGDNGQFTWTTSTNSVHLVTLSGANNVLFQNIIISSTAGTRGNGITTPTSGSSLSQNVTVQNCLLTGLNIAIQGDWTVGYTFSGLFVLNSRITASVSDGIVNASNTYVLGSMLDNNGGNGFRQATTAPIAGANISFNHSIIYKNSLNGISMVNGGSTESQLLTLLNCDVSSNTSAGVLLGNSINPVPSISNSIFDVNGTYGIDGSTGTITLQALQYTNAFYNNTTAATRNINAGIGTITLTAQPYTTVGTNFLPNSTAGGGAALKGAGFPGTIPNGGTGAPDIGAVQSFANASGGQTGYPIVQ